MSFEDRLAALHAMTPDQRASALEAMSAEEKQAMLAALSPDERIQALASFKVFIATNLVVTSVSKLLHDVLNLIGHVACGRCTKIRLKPNSRASRKKATLLKRESSPPSPLIGTS